MTDTQRIELPIDSALALSKWGVLCRCLETSESYTKTAFLQMLILCGLLINPEHESLRKLDETKLVEILKAKAKATPSLPRQNDLKELHLVAVLHSILDLAGNKFSDTWSADDIDFDFPFVENLRLCGDLIGVQPPDSQSCRIDFADGIKLLGEVSEDSADAAGTLKTLAAISAFGQGHDLQQYPSKLLGKLQSLEIVLPSVTLAEIPSELTVYLSPKEADSLADFITEAEKLSIFTTSERGLWAFWIWSLGAPPLLKSEMHNWVLRPRNLQIFREAAMQSQQAPQLIVIVLAAVSYYRLRGTSQPVQKPPYTLVCDCQVCLFDGLTQSDCAIQDGFLDDVVFALQKAMTNNTGSKDKELYFQSLIAGCQMPSHLPGPDSRLVEYFMKRLSGWDHSDAKEACCIKAQ